MSSKSIAEDTEIEMESGFLLPQSNLSSSSTISSSSSVAKSQAAGSSSDLESASKSTLSSSSSAALELDDESLDENFGAAIRRKPSILSAIHKYKWWALVLIVAVVASVIIWAVVHKFGKMGRHQSVRVDPVIHNFVLRTVPESAQQSRAEYFKECLGIQSPWKLKLGEHEDDYDEDEDDVEDDEDDEEDDDKDDDDDDDDDEDDDDDDDDDGDEDDKKGKDADKDDDDHDNDCDEIVLPTANYTDLKARYRAKSATPASSTVQAAVSKAQRKDTLPPRSPLQSMLQRIAQAPEKVALVTGGLPLAPSWSSFLFHESDSESSGAVAHLNKTDRHLLSFAFSSIFANHLLYATQYGYHTLLYDFDASKKDPGVCRHPVAGWRGVAWCQLYALQHAATLHTQMVDATAPVGCEEDTVVWEEEWRQKSAKWNGTVQGRGCPRFEYLLFTAPNTLIVSATPLSTILGLTVSGSVVPLPSVFFAPFTSSTSSSPKPTTISSTASTDVIFMRNTRHARQFLALLWASAVVYRDPVFAVNALLYLSGQPDRSQGGASMFNAVNLDVANYKAGKLIVQQCRKDQENTGESAAECIGEQGVVLTPFVSFATPLTKASKPGEEGKWLEESLLKSELEFRYASRMDELTDVHLDNEKKAMDEKFCEKRLNVLVDEDKVMRFEVEGKTLEVETKKL